MQEIEKGVSFVKLMNFIILAGLFIIQSCSLAPIVSEKTARTLGSGNWELNGGASPAYNAWVGRGVSDNLDLNFSVESQIGTVFSLGAKYAFAQGNEGLSFSLMGGAFYGANSTGYYAGPVVSVKNGWFEVYGLAKYNQVSWDGTSETTDEDTIFNFSLDQSVDFNYWMGVAGLNFWFSDGFALNVNGKKILGSDTSDDGDGIIPSVNLMFRF